MKPVPQPVICLLFLLLCLLYGYVYQLGGEIAHAQASGCSNGTISASCTYLPMISGVEGQTAENPAAATPLATATSSSTATSTLTPMPTSTPLSTPASFDSVPVEGNPTDRVPSRHGDLNLSLRGYGFTAETLELIEVNGDTDPNAPQLPGLFAEPRLPTFPAALRVHDWNWACGDDGCRGDPLTTPPVTMLEMATSNGEAIHIPSRSPEIYGGGYIALVLYAEAERITLTYLREDTVANGYAVHIENVRVDSGLLSLYQTLDSAGREELPALRNGERLGNALGSSIKVAIRDRGTFMDPRVRKNWWHGY